MASMLMSFLRRVFLTSYLSISLCVLFIALFFQPENLLLVDKKDDANLKIADFGFAKKHDASSELLKTQCGTPGCESYIGEIMTKREPWRRACRARVFFVFFNH